MEAWKLECLEAWKLGCMETWKQGSVESLKHGSIEVRKHGNIEIWKHGIRESQGITRNHKESHGITWNPMYHLLHMKAWKYEGMESNGITTQSLVIILSNDL